MIEVACEMHIINICPVQAKHPPITTHLLAVEQKPALNLHSHLEILGACGEKQYL